MKTGNEQVWVWGEGGDRTGKGRLFKQVLVNCIDLIGGPSRRHILL